MCVVDAGVHYPKQLETDASWASLHIGAIQPRHVGFAQQMWASLSQCGSVRTPTFAWRCVGVAALPGVSIGGGLGGGRPTAARSVERVVGCALASGSVGRFWTDSADGGEDTLI